MWSYIKSAVQQAKLGLVCSLSLMIAFTAAMYTRSAEERPKNAADDGHALDAKKSTDWRISAYTSIVEIKHAADQESLARIANWKLRYGTPESQAELTLALLDELNQDEETLLNKIPVHNLEESANGDLEHVNAVEPGPPSRHDLMTLRGRSAFVLERMYDIGLPPCTRNDSSKRRREIQQEALRQILRSQLRSELANVTRLNKEERLRLATNTRTSRAALDTLADDPDNDVLIALARNAGRSQDVRRKLRQRMESETDSNVKKQIREALWQHMLFPDPAPELRGLPPRQELVKQAKEKIKNDSSAN